MELFVLLLFWWPFSRTIFFRSNTKQGLEILFLIVIVRIQMGEVVQLWLNWTISFLLILPVIHEIFLTALARRVRIFTLTKTSCKKVLFLAFFLLFEMYGTPWLLTWCTLGLLFVVAEKQNLRIQTQLCCTLGLWVCSKLKSRTWEYRTNPWGCAFAFPL